MKYDTTKKILLDSDSVQSIQIAARTAPYCDFIKKCQLIPGIIVEYYSGVQLEWYKNHSKVEWTCISIDATGSLIKSPLPPKGK